MTCVLYTKKACSADMSDPGFWKSPRHTGRPTILLLIMLLVVSILATAVHEVGHLLAAVAFRQQVASFNPLAEVTLVNPPPPNVETVFNFAGGLFSALVFGIASVVLFRKPRGPSLFWLGVPFLFATFLELINGLTEGFFKLGYMLANVYYPNTYGLFLAAWASLVSLLFALVGYYVLSKTKRQQAWNRPSVDHAPATDSQLPPTPNL
jgi:hypothetical protein